MILHIFNKQEKFSVPYFRFLQDYEVNKSEHKIFHYGKSSGSLENMGWDAVFSSYFNITKHLQLYRTMKCADKVIVHSLASPFLLLLLLFNTKVSHKFYWVIWGKDLYFKDSTNIKNPVNFVYEILRMLTLRNVRHIVTNITGDYDVAIERYGLHAEFHQLDGVGYPYNVSVIYSENIVEKDKCEKILLGNSASASNCHLEALDMLKKSDDGKMEIVCPLSYGGKQKYIDKVVQKGTQLFGERFRPLIGFLALDEYNKILESVDIAYFYHNRQEAFNNTLSLIGQGKKVFLRRCSNVWKLLESKGILIHDSEELDETFLDTDSLETTKENQRRAVEIASPNLAAISWKRVFDS